MDSGQSPFTIIVPHDIGWRSCLVLDGPDRRGALGVICCGRYDGGAKGWRAFAQTPQGLVRFPGTWRLIERGLVSGRSWSTLLGYGSIGSLFADRSTSCTLHESTYDWLLDGGTRRMTFG